MTQCDFDAIGSKNLQTVIIIDDGSHISKHIISSFNYLYPYLNDNGFYIVEHPSCSLVLCTPNNACHNLLVFESLYVNFAGESIAI